MSTNKSLSIVLPVYNESKNLKILYPLIKQQLDYLCIKHYEIIFVNDGSHDTSRDIITTLHNTDPCVRGICFSKNFGYESAVLAGLSQASCDRIMIMDSDLQDPPQLISDLYNKKQEGYDIVLAQRTERKDGFVKDTTAWLFYRIINMLSEVPIPKDVGYCRICSHQVIQAVLECKEYNRFLKGLFSYVGFSTAIVHYQRPQRTVGASSFTISRLLKLGSQALFAFSAYPLKFATIIGVCIAMFGFGVGIVQIIFKLTQNNQTTGISTSIVLFSVLGGVQLLCLGIVGEYIARIYAEVKHRPLYIIRETL